MTVAELFQLNLMNDEEIVDFFISKFGKFETINEFTHKVLTLFDKMFGLRIEVVCPQCRKKQKCFYSFQETFTLPFDMILLTPQQIVKAMSENKINAKESIRQAQETITVLNTLLQIDYRAWCETCKQEIQEVRPILPDTNWPLITFVRKIIRDFELNNITLAAMTCNLGQVYNSGPAQYFDLPVNAFLEVFNNTKKIFAAKAKQ